MAKAGGKGLGECGLDGVEHLRKAGGVEGVGVGEKERHFAQFNIIFGAGAGERAHFFGRLPAAHLLVDDDAFCGGEYGGNSGLEVREGIGVGCALDVDATPAATADEGA